jgi:hypothetical protein
MGRTVVVRLGVPGDMQSMLPQWCEWGLGSYTVKKSGPPDSDAS